MIITVRLTPPFPDIITVCLFWGGDGGDNIEINFHFF